MVSWADAAALAADPRTKQAVIEVIHDRGVVALQGQVEGGAARNAAAEIASQQRGVTTVVNELMIASSV
jgi:osmotically-inducible protein OsmY